jgi:hypothetical protein
MTTDSRTDYEVLGLAPGAEEGMVRAAYKTRAKRFHPDAPDGDDEEFKKIGKAKDRILKYLARQAELAPPSSEALAAIAQRLKDAATASPARPPQGGRSGSATPALPGSPKPAPSGPPSSPAPSAIPLWQTVPKKHRKPQPHVAQSPPRPPRPGPSPWNKPAPQPSRPAPVRPPPRPRVIKPPQPVQRGGAKSSTSQASPRHRTSASSRLQPAPKSTPRPSPSETLDETYERLKKNQDDDRAQWIVYAGILRKAAANPAIGSFLRIMDELDTGATYLSIGWAIGNWDAARRQDVGMTVVLRTDAVVTVDAWTPDELEHGCQLSGVHHRAMPRLSPGGIRYFFGSIEAALKHHVEFGVKTRDQFRQLGY